MLLTADFYSRQKVYIIGGRFLLAAEKKETLL